MRLQWVQNALVMCVYVSVSVSHSLALSLFHSLLSFLLAPTTSIRHIVFGIFEMEFLEITLICRDSFRRYRSSNVFGLFVLHVNTDSIHQRTKPRKQPQTI